MQPTERGKVAENMTVWREGLIFLWMRLIWGSNPMSNILSASSKTRYVTRRRLVILPPLVTRMSIMRPGVQTTISAPRFSSVIWFATPEPPYTATTSMLCTLQNFLVSLLICCTSSLVGATTRAMGPSPCCKGGWSLMCLSMGSTKARVLPEPVSAMPMQSLPDMMIGRAWAWMGIGLSKPDLRMTSRTLPLRPHWFQFLMGL